MKKHITKKTAYKETDSIPDILRAIHQQSTLVTTHHQRFKRRGNAVLRVAIATLLGGVMIGEPAFADDASQQYKIPAQSLNNALMKFAADSNLELIFSADTVRNLNAKSLDGTMTPAQALNQLLQGSGYTYRFIDNHTVTLEKAPQSQSDTPTLKAMTVVGKTKADTDPTAYKVTNASTATKTDTPIMETPYSVTVVPQQVLKDQQVIRVEDAMKNVAGVLPSFSNLGTSDVFIMRGFQNLNLYRDGFYLPGIGATKRETANLERIEVLKGPGSILYGRTEPGGLINMVTKRPQATSYNSLQQQFGSYGFYRTTADSTGKITSDDKLLYRVNLSYENADSFRDFVKTDDVFIAPSLTWNITGQTQANLNIEYQHFDDNIDSGILPIGNRPAPVPINRQFGDPLNNRNVGDRTYVGFDWSHAFNDNWKLSHRFGAEYLDSVQDVTFVFGFANPTGNLVNLGAPSSFGSGNRGYNNAKQKQQNYYTTLNLTGKFNTAMLEHTLLSGFDYFVIDNQASTLVNGNPYPDAGATFNIFDPTYLTATPALTFKPENKRNQEWYGLYFQDQIKFPFNVYGNVGLRYDNATSQRLVPNPTNPVEDTYVSPRGGLLWRPMQWLSVFGNYSENFGPSNTPFVAPGQQVLPPQTAQQWEMGAKTEFFDGRLSASFAYFDLTKQNLPVPIPGTLLSRSIGEQESRGYEFETSGEILPGWKVIGAYTYMPYANINKDNDSSGGPALTGNRMFNTPTNFASLWNTYEFQNVDLRGLKLGAGVFASGQSQARNQNDYQLPGYATVNLLASYGMKVAGKKVTLQLNANNLLDKTYYQGTNSGTTTGFGAPRTFMGSVKLEF